MRYACFALLVLACLQLHAQDLSWQRILHEKVPGDLPMSAQLYQLAQLASVEGQVAADRKAVEMGAWVQRAGHIYVEVTMHDENRVLRTEDLRQLGLEPELIWRYMGAAHVAYSDLVPVARRLNGIGYLGAVSTRGDDFEGATVQNTDTYIAAGRDGSGITIGLIDRNYGALSATIAAGAAPSDIDTLAFPAGSIVEVPGNSQHGTGCLEALFDNAPGASYVVCRIIGNAAFAVAVDTLIARGVDVISTSSAGYNQGWNNDTGPWCQAVNTACNAGILFFNSAGNARNEHWQGDFVNDGNGAHIWNGGSDTTNVITLADSGSVNLHLQWNVANPADEYDVLLYDDQNNVVGSSVGSSGFETISYTNLTGSTADFSIVVRGNVASPPEFELFAATRDLQYAVAARSTRAPSNATHPNALSVGAVTHTSFNAAPGSNVIAGYSSNGPTNQGSQAPDITGPTDVSTTSNGGSFGGTSCATPNAAGAAAALWSAHPGYSANGIRQLLLRKAALFKDWGTPGTDMVYGHGGLFLKSFETSTIYIMQGSGNNNGTSQIPYSSIQQADQFAPTNSKAYFLGGTFADPPPGTIIDRPMIYRSVVEDATIE